MKVDLNSLLNGGEKNLWKVCHGDLNLINYGFNRCYFGDLFRKDYRGLKGFVY